MRMKENGQGQGTERKEGSTRKHSEASTSCRETGEPAGLIWKPELLQKGVQRPPTKRWKR